MIVAFRIGRTTASAAIREEGSGHAECCANSIGDYRTPCVTALAQDGTTLIVGEAAIRRKAIPQANVQLAIVADSLLKPSLEKKSVKGRTQLSKETEERKHRIETLLHQLYSDCFRTHEIRITTVVVVSDGVVSPYGSDMLQIASAAAFQRFQRQNKAAAKVHGDTRAPPTTLLVPPEVAAVCGITYQWGDRSPSTVLVVRVGGSTHTASVLRRCPDAISDVYGSLEGLTFGEWMIVASSTVQGGGSEVDKAILYDFCSEFSERYFMENPLSEKKKESLLAQCREAKLAASSGSESSIEFEYDEEETPLSSRLTVSKLDELSSHLAKKVAKTASDILAVHQQQISHVVLVGGSSTLAPVVSRIREVSKGATLIQGSSSIATDIIALGAAHFVQTVNPAHVSILSTPALAADVDDAVTDFALFLQLHGGTYGTLITPNERYPARAARNVSLLQRSSGSESFTATVRLVATKSDLSTHLCAAGCFNVTLPPSADAMVSIAVEVSFEGVVRVRVSSKKAEVTAMAAFGPFSQLAAQQ